MHLQAVLHAINQLGQTSSFFYHDDNMRTFRSSRSQTSRPSCAHIITLQTRIHQSIASTRSCCRIEPFPLVFHAPINLSKAHHDITHDVPISRIAYSNHLRSLDFIFSTMPYQTYPNTLDGLDSTPVSHTQDPTTNKRENIIEYHVCRGFK